MIDPAHPAHALLLALELLVVLRVAIDLLPLRIHGRPTRFLYEASEPLLRPLRVRARLPLLGPTDLAPALALALLAAAHGFVIYYIL